MRTGSTFEIGQGEDAQQFGTTRLFHRQVASALGIPAKYYDLMQSRKPELLAKNVNAWFGDRENSYMIRTFGLRRRPHGKGAALRPVPPD